MFGYVLTARVPSHREKRRACRATRWPAVLGGLIVAMLLPGAAAAARDNVLTTTQESDCYEVLINRAAKPELASALVPARYTLLRPSATTVRLRIIDYHCESLTVDGHPPVRETTVSMIGFEIAQRAGEPASGVYLLAVATNNPVLFAQYRAAGLPAEFQRRTRSSETLNEDGTSTIEWAFVGDGLDHTVSAVPPELQGLPTPSTGTFYYDSRRGDLRLRFNNLSRSSAPPAGLGALVSADLTAASEITPLLTLPRFEIIDRVRFGFIRGSWTGVLERLDTEAP